MILVYVYRLVSVFFVVAGVYFYWYGHLVDIDVCVCRQGQKCVSDVIRYSLHCREVFFTRIVTVSTTHLRAHVTKAKIVCHLLVEKKTSLAR